MSSSYEDAPAASPAAKNASHASLGSLAQAPNRFQGVVLVDSFTQKFRPVTLQMPKVLLPLGGFQHMLDLNLEWLSSAGVAELILLSCAHTDMIREYVYGSDNKYKNVNNSKAQSENRDSTNEEDNDNTHNSIWSRLSGVTSRRRRPLFNPLKKFSKVTIIECTDCLSAGTSLFALSF